MPDNNEYHVASFIAHAMAAELEQVKEEITQYNGAEIHAVGDTGKIVFTLEAKSQQAIGKKIDKIRLHKGILSLSPVYHQFLTENQEPNELTNNK